MIIILNDNNRFTKSYFIYICTCKFIFFNIKDLFVYKSIYIWEYLFVFFFAIIRNMCCYMIKIKINPLPIHTLKKKKNEPYSNNNRL